MLTFYDQSPFQSRKLNYQETTFHLLQGHNELALPNRDKISKLDNMYTFKQLELLMASISRKFETEVFMKDKVVLDNKLKREFLLYQHYV